MIARAAAPPSHPDTDLTAGSAAALRAAAHPARIGPNAILRVAEALAKCCSPWAVAAVFERAGLLRYLDAPPQGMVDETEVQRLHATLRRDLPPPVAEHVLRDAGRATADYLLAHRIPKPVQALLHALPAPLACRVLLAAITRHAWTFAGSGHFTARPGTPTVLTVTDNPLCRGQHAEAPACTYYAATFERLFRVLVHPDARVVERSCEARGDEACVFVIDWR